MINDIDNDKFYLVECPSCLSKRKTSGSALQVHEGTKHHKPFKYVVYTCKKGDCLCQNFIDLDKIDLYDKSNIVNPVIKTDEHGDKFGFIKVNFDLEVFLGEDGDEYTVDDVWHAIGNISEGELGSMLLEKGLKKKNVVLES